MTHRDGKLWAISDLHCNRPATWKYIKEMGSHNDDWILIAGDVCDGWSEEKFTSCLHLFTHRFGKVVWTPGNHELYTRPHLHSESGDVSAGGVQSGPAQYERLITLCHQCGVLTPEDPYLRYRGASRGRPDTPFISPSSSEAYAKKEKQRDADEIPLYICPIFTLYDYSFRPNYVKREDALAWAQAQGVNCTDEIALRNEPFSSREEWCWERIDRTERKLEEITLDGSHTVLCSHFPLRYDTVICPYVPAFSVWCGSERTAEFHLRFNAEAVVFGHTHNRATTLVDNVQFHEVSLGYPNQYQSSNKIEYYFSQILPHKTSIEGCNVF